MASPLSELAKFDDLRRCLSVFLDDNAEEAFLHFARQLEDTRQQWQLSVDENVKMRRELDAAMKSMANLESKLNNARKLLELESKARREAEHERGQLEKKLYLVKDLLSSDNNIKDETRSKFEFLNKMRDERHRSRMSALEEQMSMDVNSTGSILSDLSLTRSENDFLDRRSDVGKQKRWRKSKSLAADGTPRRKSQQKSTIVHNTGTEKIVAHTKVTVPQDEGPILAESCVEAVPVASTMEFKTPRKSPRKIIKPTAPPLETPRRTVRPHDFDEKTFFIPQTCNQCNKSIRFGSLGLRCKRCNIVCHPDPCKNRMEIDCVPQSVSKSQPLKLADFVSNNAPMVPAILIHCINEIENRGFNEEGLYRISGLQSEVKAMMDKFKRSKTPPCLTEVDTHVLCSLVKEFLRNLQDGVIPEYTWSGFYAAMNHADADHELQKCIFALPRANRDTLAFIVIHLQRVSQCKKVLMSFENLSKIFAPTLVAPTVHQDEREAINELIRKTQLVGFLLTISQNFWVQFINPSYTEGTTSTAESESYVAVGSETPVVYKNLKRKKRFYDTPPYNKKK